MMEFLLVDIAAWVLYLFKGLVILLAFLLLLFGLDDLFIDLSYWLRRIYRRLFVYSNFPKADEQLLFTVPEKPLAIMVPAWNEVGVVGKMAELAASTLEYENYQIFVGVYPNDPDTQRDVDQVCQLYHHVHKVVCARPGPTSKADCLNNVIDAIFSFEAVAGVQFAGFILHDAEDVVSPLELRLFNYLLPRKDLIQVPVYPFVPRWYEFTSAHYMDEFAEQHGKDIVVREALVGQVPSAGVGTCFSRRAMLALLADGDGIAFDVLSLTEDYDIGYRLKQKGMSEIFARFRVKNQRYVKWVEKGFGVSREHTGVICVREYFPRSFSHAVRQKSRWITGIVFQGTRNLGWAKGSMLNYFLWRDRRGVLTNFVGFLVNLVIIIALLVWLNNLLFPDAWQFPSILDGNPIFLAVLGVNLLLLSNRVLQRFYFVLSYYGLAQACLSIPRVLWANVINFTATARALINVVRAGDARRVAWDKTQHEFPSVDEVKRVPIGNYLVEQGAISAETLEELLQKSRRIKFGSALLQHGYVTPQELGRALATQAHLEYWDQHPLQIPKALIEAFPRALALRYAVLPLAERNDVLMLGVDKVLSPVATGAIARHLGRKVRLYMLPAGFATIGIRFWFSSVEHRDADPVLHALAERPDDMALLSVAARHQMLLGDLIQQLGMLTPQVLAQALFDYDPLKKNIGAFLVEKQLISNELLQQALIVQSRLRARSAELVEAELTAREGVGGLLVS